MTRPNILLIVFDTARADVFEPYGGTIGTTPAMAQLASRGAAVQNVFSSASWTVPAHATLFSGLLPRSVGMGHIGGSTHAQFKRRMHELAPQLLPEVLRRHGYRTSGLSANLWVSEESGFDVGFESFRYLKSRRNHKIDSKRTIDKLQWYLEAVRASVDDGASAVIALLEEWSRGRGHDPFFWFVNLIECHSPYLPPRPFNDLSLRGRLRAAAEAREHMNLFRIWRCCAAEFDIPDPALDRMQRLYRASIKQLDDWLARVLELLDKEKLLDDTQVVVISDHGENFGEGGLCGHAFSLDDRLIRVPLVTAGPGTFATSGATSIAAIPGWLAALAGVDDQPFSSPDSVEGVAVAQFDAPVRRGDTQATEQLALWDIRPEILPRAIDRMSDSFTCATDGRLKLFRHRAGDWFIDLEADPLEERAVPVGPELEKGFEPRLKRLRDALDRAGEHELPSVSQASRSRPDENAPGDTENAELEEQMRLLGYL